MRRPTTRSPLGLLFAFYFLAFLFFFVRAIFGFPSRELLSIFLWPYVWSEAFLQLMRYAIPVTLAGTHATLVPLALEHRDDLAEAVKDGEL